MFQITRIGCNFIHQNGIDLQRPKGTETYLFLYFKTTVEIQKDGEYFLQEQPCFYLFPKNTPHFYRKKDGAFNNDFIHFHMNPDDEFFKELDIPYETPMMIHNGAAIHNMMTDIRNEFFQVSPHSEQILDAKMKALFYKFSDMYHQDTTFSSKTIRYRNSFSKIRNDLYSFQYTNPSVAEIAASLNLSVSYFQHIYKELFGVSLTHDIIRSRIEKACQLLHSTRNSISDIAYQCGYENKEHFSRQFKEVIGCSPKDYRA